MSCFLSLRVATDVLHYKQLIASNPQNLHTNDIYISHPPQYTDSFLLLVKAVMLFGKVTDHNTEYQLQHPASPCKTDDPCCRPSFKSLDKLVADDFLENLPAQYHRYLYDLGQCPETVGIDTDLYMVHLIPHAYASIFCDRLHPHSF